MCGSNAPWHPDEPETEPPWAPEHCPAPVMCTWPRGSGPALRVRMAGRWWLAAVELSAVYPDGRTVHHVQTLLAGHSGTYHRTYRWPPPGKLRIGSPPAAPPRRL